MVIFDSERKVFEDLKVLRVENDRLDDCSSYHNCDLAEVIFGYCKVCNKMAALPQGAFAAIKLKSSGKQKGPTIMPSTAKPKIFNDSRKLMEYTPVKYNSKLMNSIWGFYNRYSPHNIKSNDDNEVMEVEVFLQQPLAVAGYVIANKLQSSLESEKIWKL